MAETSSDNFIEGLSFEPEPVSPYEPTSGSMRRAFILLGLTFGGLLALALVVFNLFSSGTRGRDVPPIIVADNTPFKVEPEVPGGDIAPELDREVFGTIDGQTEGDVETAPEPEQPLDLPTTPPADELPDAVTIEVEPAIPARPDPEPEPEPETAPESSEPTPPAPTPAAPAPTLSVTGGSSNWVVQVASLRSQQEAQNTYSRIAGNFSGAIPTTAYADIVRADLGDKGIYYRARVAGLADKSAANRLCETFKARNQACFVTRR